MITCEDFATKTLDNGALYNNVWNKSAAGSFKWRQCLEKSLDGKMHGWSWTWPENGIFIYGYPQIKTGISPWAPESKINPAFPLKIAGARSVVVTHELEVSGNTQHNIATTMWLTNTAAIGTVQNPSVITAEVMIWTYSSPKHMNPAGRHVDNFISDGITWEVWTERNWGGGAASGPKENKWSNLTFRAKQSSFKAKYDALKFARYGIEKGILDPGSYIADVEVGMEIMSGSGLTWVREFKVDVQQ